MADPFLPPPAVTNRLLNLLDKWNRFLLFFNERTFIYLFVCLFVCFKERTKNMITKDNYKYSGFHQECIPLGMFMR